MENSLTRWYHQDDIIEMTSSRWHYRDDIIANLVQRSRNETAYVYQQTQDIDCYDTVAEWGLQDARALIDPVIVEVNRGIGLADMIIMIPLFIIAVMGLWRNKFYGAVTSWMALGISLYWPVVFWCSQFFYARADIKHQTAPVSTHVILIFIITVSLWASWYLYRYYKKNV